MAELDQWTEVAFGASHDGSAKEDRGSGVGRRDEPTATGEAAIATDSSLDSFEAHLGIAFPDELGHVAHDECHKPSANSYEPRLSSFHVRQIVLHEIDWLDVAVDELKRLVFLDQIEHRSGDFWR